MKNIKLQIIIPEEYVYINLFINGRNSIFQNWKSKMKVKKIDEHIHFITFNIMEQVLEYKLILELETGEFIEELIRTLDVTQNCSVNVIFNESNATDVIYEPEKIIEPVKIPEYYNNYAPNIHFYNEQNYYDEDQSNYNNSSDESDSSDDNLYEYSNNYTRKPKKTSSKYHLVSGYSKGDTKVKAYARGNAPASLKKKTIVSGYVNKNGTKVKAYTRKKNK